MGVIIPIVMQLVVGCTNVRLLSVCGKMVNCLRVTVADPDIDSLETMAMFIVVLLILKKNMPLTSSKRRIHCLYQRRCRVHFLLLHLFFHPFPLFNHLYCRVSRSHIQNLRSSPRMRTTKFPKEHLLMLIGAVPAVVITRKLSEETSVPKVLQKITMKVQR